MTIEEVISENKRRNDLLDEPYDPLTGEGSPIERRKLPWGDFPIMYVPATMFGDESDKGRLFDILCKYDTLEAASDSLNLDIDFIHGFIVDYRYDHDFEFWAITTIKIYDKDKFIEVPFRLRRAQRKLLAELESMRVSGVPIRIVLLKARQWGGSTLVQIYMMWIQQRHRTNWHMAVCAHEDPVAGNISAMYGYAAKAYPPEVGAITFKPYARSPKNIVNIERGGIIGVGSANNPDQFRSYNYAMIHLSEVGLFPNTPKRSASSLIASLKETVPDEPYTIVVEESTARGINYFYDSWKRATRGKTRYKAVFVPWYEIDRCRIKLDVTEEEFWMGMNDYDKFLWGLGATLEGINWYNKHKADRYAEVEEAGGSFSEYLMLQENPSTPEEAFQSAGEKRFKLEYIQAMEKDCMVPEWVGEVKGLSDQGPKALRHVELVKNLSGNLRIWSMPDMSVKVTDRYCAYADIGGTWRGADYSVLVVIDRYGMIDGGDPEVVAVWHGHLDKDLFGWKCAQVCSLYGNALLAIESNTYDKDRRLDDHFLTVIEKIADHYPNLYARNDPEKVGDEYVPKWGFQMNKKTKPNVINILHACSRERFLRNEGKKNGPALVVRDLRICKQMSMFEQKPDGTLGAVEGEKDDLVDATAGAAWLAIEYMPIPREITETPVQHKKLRKTEASF